MPPPKPNVMRAFEATYGAGKLTVDLYETKVSGYRVLRQGQVLRGGEVGQAGRQALTAFLRGCRRNWRSEPTAWPERITRVQSSLID